MSEERQKRKSQAPVEDVVEDDDSSEEMTLSDDEGTLIDGIRIPPSGKPVCSFDPKGPRLIITKISNFFFKSYANEQVLGPFHKCFNAIVGPNGSGKSNVIDSMLFVFGYRASKIRSKKVSVLLHNSEKYQNVRSCKVSVHFAQIIDKAGDGYEIVPDSEFVVSRTALKDNSSYYTLNTRKVQFKEVGKLLKQHGIDLDHNRFLILQGEVEQIAMMKCKGEGEHETGMLEYLEDIIGTSRYKKPLAQVQERVDLLTEQRTEKLNRVQLVEKELEKLKEPMQEAVGFLKAENTVVNSKNFLYQKNIFDIERKMESVEVSRREVVEKQKEFEENMEKLNKEKHEKEKILKQESEKYEKLQSRKDAMTEAFNKANNKDIQLQEDMTQTNKTRKKTKELIVEEKKKLEKLGKVPEESKNGIEECEAKIEEVSVKKEKYEEEKTKLLTNLRTETKALQDKKEELQNDLVVLKKTADETKAAFALAESELKIYVSSTENEGAKLDSLKKEYETSKSTIEERLKQVGALKKKIPATEKSLKEATEELNGVKYQEAQVINEIRKNRSSLEEKKNSMQASRSRGKVLDGLMRQKTEGNCPGLYGRLGDLGAIDKKYDVAISTACGPLDNIVVDSVDTAQWCIEFLKKYDLGRATFIALDKQEHLRNQANAKINTPENVHRLFDLVKIQDENVRPAFYYALRDTLVANDLDQASRIAYGSQRFRVVTLEGHLIETTGTMSGGGKTVSRGRMGQSVRVSNVNPRELENMQEDIEQLESSVRELRQKQTSLENQINTLEPELRQMVFDSKKFSMELQELQQRMPQLEKQVKAQEAKSKATKADPTEVKRLTKIVDQKRALYEKAAETADELQVQVDKISQEINEKTSGKMKAIDKNIMEATKTIDKCKAEITRLRVAITTAERNAKKSEQKIKTMEQDVVDMEEKLRRMKNERTEIEEDAAKLLKCVEEITELMTEGEEAYSSIKKEVADLTKQVNELKSEKVDVDQKVKTLNGKVNDYKGAIHQLEVKISRLELQDVLNDSNNVLKKYTREELDEMDADSITREMEAAENHIKIAKPNLSAIEEYRKQQGVYVERSKELEEISNKRTQMRALHDSLRLQRKEEFMTGFNIIRSKLKEMYQMITLGGDADFEMVDNYDPFTEGIQFNVRPPKKSWKKISNLSGGEKTLASLALVFALHYYKPSPLYVMDEIDAALDFKNVSIVGNYIKERTKNAQFIIISLRSNMFELCDNLIGIYKTYDCTKTITIDPRVYENKEEQQPIRRLNVTEKQNVSHANDENTVPHANSENTVPHANGENTVTNGDKIVDETNDECMDTEEQIVNATSDSSGSVSQRSNAEGIINDSFQPEAMEQDS